MPPNPYLPTSSAMRHLALAHLKVPCLPTCPVPPAFEVEVKHFSTMKDILLDRMASLSPGGIPVGSQGPVDERGFPQNRLGVGVGVRGRGRG